MARQPTQSDMAREDVADRPRRLSASPLAETRPGRAVPRTLQPAPSSTVRLGDRGRGRLRTHCLGKSALAEALADALATEVVSADAMQVYRGLPILTNQSPRPARLVAIRDLGEEMSVGAFASLAHTEIDWLVERHGSAVVAGGTGLYLRAALADLDMPPAVAPEVRERIRDEVARHPRSAHGRLANLDAEAAFAVHPHDAQRLARALELAESGHTLVGRRSPVEHGDEAPDAHRRPRRARRRAGAPDSSSHGADVRSRGRRRGPARARGTRLAHRREGARPPRDRNARASRRTRADRRSNAAGTRHTSESGCGGSRGSCCSTARDPCRRSPQTCSGDFGGNVRSDAVREVARARERLRARRAAGCRAALGRPRPKDLRRPHRDRQRRRARDRLA